MLYHFRRTLPGVSNCSDSAEEIMRRNTKSRKERRLRAGGNDRSRAFGGLGRRGSTVGSGLTAPMKRPAIRG